jgi:hypothetical protein
MASKSFAKYPFGEKDGLQYLEDICAMSGWSDKYENWLVEQFDRAKKKEFKIAFLSHQPLIAQISSKYCKPSFSPNGYLAKLLLAMFSVQLVLNIFNISYLFSD